MNYHILREIADSWVLLMMFAFFVGAILWIWRPGSRAAQDDAGQIPFRHDDGPGSLGEQQK
jgi:cytochrome c oxidase cbb3-type subunit 4